MPDWPLSVNLLATVLVGYTLWCWARDLAASPAWMGVWATPGMFEALPGSDTPEAAVWGGRVVLAGLGVALTAGVIAMGVAVVRSGIVDDWPLLLAVCGIFWAGLLTVVAVAGMVGWLVETWWPRRTGRDGLAFWRRLVYEDGEGGYQIGDEDDEVG